MKLIRRDNSVALKFIYSDLYRFNLFFYCSNDFKHRYLIVELNSSTHNNISNM